MRGWAKISQRSAEISRGESKGDWVQTMGKWTWANAHEGGGTTFCRPIFFYFILVHTWIVFFILLYCNSSYIHTCLCNYLNGEQGARSKGRGRREEEGAREGDSMGIHSHPHLAARVRQRETEGGGWRWPGRGRRRRGGGCYVRTTYLCRCIGLPRFFSL